MDVIYIVSNDPIHEHIELRYSIRSLVKHLKGFDRIFIVGHCPDFLKGVFHIPLPDAHRYNLARNIYEKILAACNDKRVSANFFAIHRDHFLLTDYDIGAFPVYRNNYQQTLPDLLGRLSDKNYYRPFVDATIKVLQSKNLPVINYNVHTPIIYDKKLFKKVMTSYDWSGRVGYIAKSLYCNTLGLPGEPFEDNKIHTPKTKSAIQRFITGRQIFSTNEFSVNAEMKETFQELYPEPSKLENKFTKTYSHETNT